MAFHVGQKVTPKRADTDWAAAANVCHPDAVPIFKQPYTVAKIVDTSPVYTLIALFVGASPATAMLQLVEVNGGCTCGNGKGQLAFDADEFRPLKTAETGMGMLRALLRPFTEKPPAGSVKKREKVT